MLKNLTLNKIIWTTTTILSLIAAVYGLFNNHIYQNLMPAGFVAAQFGQDILTILICLILFFLIARAREDSYKEPIMILGIIGSLAYLYGIFSIERVYNEMYLIYLGILSTASYSILLFFSSLDLTFVKRITVPRGIRLTTSIFSFLVGVLFSLLWVSALLPLMRTHQQIDNLFSIYLLDLAYVMPAFFITATLTILKNPLGPILTPAIDILGIFVIFPLGLGELIKPYFGMTTNPKDMVMSFLLSGLFVLASLIQLLTMRKVDSNGRQN